MFSNIYNIWNHYTDSNYILSKINLFYYINIKYFKVKNISFISFFINSLYSLKIKNVKIYKNSFKFETLYFIFLKIFIIVFFVLLF